MRPSAIGTILIRKCILKFSFRCSQMQTFTEHLRKQSIIKKIFFTCFWKWTHPNIIFTHVKVVNLLFYSQISLGQCESLYRDVSRTEFVSQVPLHDFIKIWVIWNLSWWRPTSHFMTFVCTCRGMSTFIKKCSIYNTQRLFALDNKYGLK